MSNGYSSKIRVCPFFASDGRTCIRCEGGTKLQFPDPQSTRDYTDAFCADTKGWQKCTYAIELSKYYDRIDAEKEG